MLSESSSAVRNKCFGGPRCLLLLGEDGGRRGNLRISNIYLWQVLVLNASKSEPAVVQFAS